MAEQVGSSECSVGRDTFSQLDLANVFLSITDREGISEAAGSEHRVMTGPAARERCLLCASAGISLSRQRYAC